VEIGLEEFGPDMVHFESGQQHIYVVGTPHVMKKFPITKLMQTVSPGALVVDISEDKFKYAKAMTFQYGNVENFPPLKKKFGEIANKFMNSKSVGEAERKMMEDVYKERLPEITGVVYMEAIEKAALLGIKVLYVPPNVTETTISELFTSEWSEAVNKVGFATQAMKLMEALKNGNGLFEPEVLVSLKDYFPRSYSILIGQTQNKIAREARAAGNTVALVNRLHFEGLAQLWSNEHLLKQEQAVQSSSQPGSKAALGNLVQNLRNKLFGPK